MLFVTCPPNSIDHGQGTLPEKKDRGSGPSSSRKKAQTQLSRFPETMQLQWLKRSSLVCSPQRRARRPEVKHTLSNAFLGRGMSFSTCLKGLLNWVHKEKKRTATSRLCKNHYI